MEMGRGVVVVAGKTESKKLTTFTCWDGYEFAHVKAEDPADADEKNEQDNILIIEGKVEDIGVRHVKEKSGLSRFELELEDELKPGVRCTITIEDPVRIANAIYSAEVGINGDKFLVFVKKGVKFWVFSDVLLFNSIGGKRL